jgi:hypothetical protein
MKISKSQSLLFSSLLAVPVSSHTWVEQMSVIGSNGSYIGVHGYPRGYVVRNDTAMTVLSPPNGQARTRINSSDTICSTSQSTPNSNIPAWPQLIAMPGNYVAARYLENGHVTRTETYVGASQSQVGKPGSGGLVYIYGTTNTANQKLMDVMQWGPNSTLAEGRLLAINNFDDGRCYQISNSPALPQREAEAPDPVPGQPGTEHELWCETNFQIPNDAQEGSLTMYWVWQWPTLPNMDPSVAQGKDEVYTTCADIKVTTNSAVVAAAVPGTPHPIQDPMPNAVESYKDRAANVTFPSNKAFYGPNNANGPQSSSATTPTSVATGAASAPPASTPAPAATPPAANTPPAPAVPAPVTVTVTKTAMSVSVSVSTVTVEASPAACNSGSSGQAPPFSGSPAGGFPGPAAGAGRFTSYAYAYTTTDVDVTVTATGAPSLRRRHGRFYGDFE